MGWSAFSLLAVLAGGAFWLFRMGRKRERGKRAENTNETLEDIEKALQDDNLRADVRDDLIVRDDGD